MKRRLSGRLRWFRVFVLRCMTHALRENSTRNFFLEKPQQSSEGKRNPTGERQPALLIPSPSLGLCLASLAAGGVFKFDRTTLAGE